MSEGTKESFKFGDLCAVSKRDCAATGIAYLDIRVLEEFLMSILEEESPNDSLVQQGILPIFTCKSGLPIALVSKDTD